MGYVQAGYSIVLAILFLYGVSLLVRRRRLNRAVARLVGPPHAEGQPPGRGGASSAHAGIVPGPAPSVGPSQEPVGAGPDMRGRS